MTSASSPVCSSASSTRSTTSRRQRCALSSPVPSAIPTPRVPQTFELSGRINDAEKAVKRLVADADLHNGHHNEPSTATIDTEAQQRREGVTQDAGSDDDDTDDEGDDAMSIDALEDQFALLEEEVATLVADVHDLALYTKLNITGFMKILKVRHAIVVSASSRDRD